MKLLFSIPWQFNLLQLLTIIAFFIMILFVAYPFIHAFDVYLINSCNSCLNKKMKYFSDKGENIASIVIILFTLIYFAFSFYVVVNHGHIINSFLDNKSNVNNLYSLLHSSTFSMDMAPLSIEAKRYVIAIILNRVFNSFVVNGSIMQSIIDNNDSDLLLNVKWTLVLLLLLSLVSITIILMSIYRKKHEK